MSTGATRACFALCPNSGMLGLGSCIAGIYRLLKIFMQCLQKYVYDDREELVGNIIFLNFTSILAIFWYLI
jgi:hypothetical protein